MTIKILTETFSSLGTNAYGDVVGTVTVDLGRGSLVTAKAYQSMFGINVAGFIGRYVTSAKPWLAHVYGKGDGVFVTFGRDDRSGRFNKANAISWQPDLYAQLSNAAVWKPVEG